MTGIYAILNILNDKVYVGSATNLAFRWYGHRRNLNKNIHKNKHLQSSWNRYTQFCFIFVVLEYVEDKSVLYVKEQSWIDKLKACDRLYGYNISIVAGSQLGLRWKAKSTIKGISRNKGVSKTEEHKKKLSDVQKGRIFTDEHRKNLREGIRKSRSKIFKFTSVIILE